MGRLNNWLNAAGMLFFRNTITLAGASITTASVFSIAAFTVIGVLGLADSPYLGIVAFLILPGVFVFGLLLIPVGLIYERRKAKPKEGESLQLPVFDLNQPKIRRAVVIVAFLTGANLFIISTVSYQGVMYMESQEFCGQVCHSVMEPEYTAYLDSPHSRVKCVECHIGPGAPWFVRSKLSGVRQVFAVNLNTYATPIPAPVPHLRPSQDTCEECHWPEKFTGDRVKVRRRYEEDETNTELTSVLLMHIGGGGAESGIHSWHINPDRRTTYYATDDARQEIAFVRVEHGDGTVDEYTADGADIDPAQMTDANMRVMDCIDCHNRPSHVFELPGPALDDALEEGSIARDLPYIKQAGVEALNNAVSADDGLTSIADDLRAHFQENSPEVLESRKEDVDQAISTMQAIYSRNIFPNMNVTWGTYPQHIGHTESPGCFRCHDDSHSTPDGDLIRQDCTICHTVLAWDEESPAIMSELGVE